MKQAEYFMDIDRDTSRAPLAPRPLGEIGRAGMSGTDGQTGAQRKARTAARGGALITMVA